LIPTSKSATGGNIPKIRVFVIKVDIGNRVRETRPGYGPRRRGARTRVVFDGRQALRRAAPLTIAGVLEIPDEPPFEHAAITVEAATKTAMNRNFTFVLCRRKIANRAYYRCLMNRNSLRVIERRTRPDNLSRRTNRAVGGRRKNGYSRAKARLHASSGLRRKNIDFVKACVAGNDSPVRIAGIVKL